MPMIGAMEEVLRAAKQERDELWPNCKAVFARAVFDRYNITNEADLLDAAARIEAFRKAEKDSNSDLNSDKNRDSGPGIEAVAGADDRR